MVSSIEHAHMDSMEGVEGSDRIDPQLLDICPQTPANGVNGEPNGVSSTNLQSISPSCRRNSTAVTSSSPGVSRPVQVTPHKKSQTPRKSSRTTSTPKSSTGRRDSKGNIRLEPKSEPRQRAMPLSETHDADEASLALALQLQKEEHGLRRRSR